MRNIHHVMGERAMRATLIIGAILLLSMLVVLPSNFAFAASADQTGTAETAEKEAQQSMEKPMNLNTLPQGEQSQQELGSRNEIPMRAPVDLEGNHLLRPQAKHFLEEANVSTDLQQEINIQDELSSYAF
jgi:hypothetical protein